MGLGSRIKLLVMGAACAIGASSTKAEEGKFWNIRSDHLNCLLANSAAYLEGASDPIIIFLTVCPQTDLEEILKGSTKNLSIVAPDVQSDSKDEPAEVVVFTRQQLECLRDISFDLSVPVLEIPRDPCS